MGWQSAFYIIPMLVAGAVPVAFILYAVRQWRSSRLVKIFVFIMVSLSIWSFGYALELWSESLSLSLVFVKIEYLGIVTLPVAWFMFALEYTGRKKWVTSGNTLLLLVIPLSGLILCWTNYGHLFYRSVRLASGAVFPVEASYGPALWFLIIYLHSITLAGVILILVEVVKQGKLYLKQGLISSAGVIIPVAGNIIYLTGVTSGYDITPLLFNVTGAVLVWLIFRFGFLDITPIAYDVIFKNIEDAIVIVDNEGKIVNFNEAGRKFLSPQNIGANIGELLLPDALEGKRSEIKRRRKYYDVLVSRIRGGGNRSLGKVIILRDITRRKKAEERISQLNGTLRLINKIMRHDILNDLQIANSSLELYSGGEGKKFMEKALERINKSINLIKMMREFESMVSSGSKLKEYNAKEIVEDVIKDYDVRFNVSGDCRIMADEAFYSVIDNIVRNAIVHGGTDRIDITISGENGCEIRIADFGKGIPDEIKERVFDEQFVYGETGGTGLGLYIVKKTVERYGGSIRVEDNKPKGTVFVIKLKKLQNAV